MQVTVPLVPVLPISVDHLLVYALLCVALLVGIKWMLDN